MGLRRKDRALGTPGPPLGNPVGPRRSIEEHAPFQRFAARGPWPLVASWQVARTIANAATGTRIEVWSDAAPISLMADGRTANPYRTPLVAAAYGADGEIQAMFAVETAPEMHGEVYAIHFGSGQRTNLGAHPELLRIEAFADAAVAHLRPPVAATPGPAGGQARGRIATVVPPGWSFFKESLTIRSDDGQANVIVSSEPLAPTMDTAAYAATQARLLAVEFVGYRELGTGELLVNGTTPMIWRHFSWNPPMQAPVAQVQGYLVVDGRGWTATGSALLDEWDRYGDAIRLVLEGIAIDFGAQEGGGPSRTWG